MSVNQSRGDKNESSQYRRTGGRSGNSTSQRNYSGGGGKVGGGGGGSTTAPPSSASLSSNRSFKKTNNYAQGVQHRVNTPNTNSDSLNSSATGGTTATNGAHLQPPARGASGAPAAGATVKPSDGSSEKSTVGLPRATQGNAGVPGSDTTGPSTPTKEPIDASKAFPLQFGSISPGLMNGMQIPARTSSAPPNLDEQKQAQARLESLKATKAQTPAIPKQQIPRKDIGPVDPSNVPEAHPIPKPKKEIQPVPTPAAQSQKLPGPPIPMQPQIPFHHSQLHVQYGGLNPQIQSSGMTNLPLPIPLPMGSPPHVQQPLFVTGVQHHQMQQPQGIIHQGQSLNFSSQMGPPQMPPQLGNMGIGLGQHYSPQQTGKLSAQRKPVKITDPKTHEELSLHVVSKGPGGPTHGSNLPHGVIPPGYPINFYPNLFNAGPVFFQPPAANPLTNAQTTHGSQLPRVYSQISILKIKSHEQGLKSVTRINQSRSLTN